MWLKVDKTVIRMSFDRPGLSPSLATPRGHRLVEYRSEQRALEVLDAFWKTIQAGGDYFEFPEG